jgi:hypothetical protein
MPGQSAQLLTVAIALGTGVVCYRALQRHERKAYLNKYQFRLVGVVGFLFFMLGTFVALKNLIL